MFLLVHTIKEKEEKNLGAKRSLLKTINKKKIYIYIYILGLILLFFHICGKMQA